MLMARLGRVWTISARTQLAPQPILRRGGVEQQHVAPPHRLGQRPEGLGRRIDHKKVDAAALARLQHRRRDRVCGRDGDALEREVDLERAAERLRLVDADLRPDKRMLAGSEDHALIGTDRLMARVAFDIDNADRDARRRRILCGTAIRKTRSDNDRDRSIATSAAGASPPPIREANGGEGARRASRETTRPKSMTG